MKINRSLSLRVKPFSFQHPLNSQPLQPLLLQLTTTPSPTHNHLSLRRTSSTYNLFDSQARQLTTSSTYTTIYNPFNPQPGASTRAPPPLNPRSLIPCDLLNLQPTPPLNLHLPYTVWGACLYPHVWVWDTYCNCLCSLIG